MVPSLRPSSCFPVLALASSLGVALPSATAQCEVQKLSVGWPGDASKDVLFIRVPGDSEAGSSAGACYVFERSATGWVQVQKLIGADTTTGDEFGNNVSVSGDTVVIAAHSDDDLGSSSGSVYVFERQPSGWVQTDKLTPQDGAAGDQFGEAVSLQGDTLAVGAWLAPHGGVNSGAAYVFQRTGGSGRSPPSSCRATGSPATASGRTCSFRAPRSS